jgi:PAS domain S-box-containing protein
LAGKTLFSLLTDGRIRLIFGVVMLLTSVVGISLLGADVLRQISRETESRSDNAVWALSQIEVELLYLLAATDASEHGEGTLADVRLRYDIFYSRMNTLLDGSVFGNLRRTEEYQTNIKVLRAFMDAELPFFDGPDEALRARIPTLRDNARGVEEAARAVAMSGITVIADMSDQRRHDVTRTMVLAWSLTLILIAFLAATVVQLLRLSRFNRLRAAENQATLLRLDAVVSTALEALVTVDGAGRIVDFNEAASQTFGFSRSEAIGADMADLIGADPSEQKLFRSGLAPDMAGQGRVRIPTRHKDGRIIPAEVAISRITSGEGPLFVAFLRDLSAQLAAESALVIARDEALAGEKAKANLLIVMSHEIRTPLNGMIGTIELLDSTELAPQQREYLHIMQASSKLLMHHVNDVLDIARLDSGKARIVAAPIDLTALVQEVVENQRPASRMGGNELAFIPPPDARTMVECDGAQLRQVLLNLLGNAVKFTRNGRIEVKVAHLGPTGPTEITVTDTGIGMAEADLERIFDDFVTLDTSYARKVTGTGLGLGIVRRIVQQMGGSLRVESRKGMGSTFRVSLPLTILEPMSAPGVEMPAPEKAPTGRLVALVVEDNDFNRLIVREMLISEGHEVVEAHDGDEGIEIAASRRFDLILMDISMPRVDGLQAARAILAGNGASRQTPIVAMTAHAMADEAARFRDGGMMQVLVKPITREGLRAVLAAAIPSGLDELLDMSQLASLSVDLGHARAQQLVQRFRAEAGETMERLGTGNVLMDQITVRELHRLAGSSAMFGAIALHGVLAELETAWKTGERSIAAEARLPEVWRRTEAAFQEVSAFDQPSSLR